MEFNFKSCIPINARVMLLIDRKPIGIHEVHGRPCGDYKLTIMSLFARTPKFLKLIHQCLFAYCAHEGGCDHACVVILQQLVPLNYLGVINPNCF